MSLKREIFHYYDNIDAIFLGESEVCLSELCDILDKGVPFEKASLPGLMKANDIEFTKPKMHPTLDDIGEYDYSIFDRQVFLRAFQGNVVNAVDFEISRGCIYTCDYCVETVIQSFYDFEERSSKGALKNWTGYLRSKSAKRAFAEFKS